MQNNADFRFSRMDRLSIGFVTCLLWAMLAGMAWTAVMMAASGEGMAALVLAITALFFALLGTIVLRDCRMKWRWRVLLGPQEAALSLPAGRLLLGSDPPCFQMLPYSEIRQLEWREETFTSLGLVTVNRVHAIRLKDGGLILLGEDRPIPKTAAYTTLAGEAAQALAAAAGVRLRQIKSARGEGGFLTLWGARRPDWPDAAAR